MTTATIAQTEQDFFARVISASAQCKSLQETAATNPESFEWALSIELPRIMNRLLADEARLFYDEDAISLIAKAIWEDARATQ